MLYVMCQGATVMWGQAGSRLLQSRIRRKNHHNWISVPSWNGFRVQPPNSTTCLLKKQCLNLSISCCQRSKEGEINHQPTTKRKRRKRLVTYFSCLALTSFFGLRGKREQMLA